MNSLIFKLYRCLVGLALAAMLGAPLAGYAEDAPVYTISPNDVISIDVVGHEDMHVQNRVDAAGNFQYVYVHKLIHVGGLTQEEASDAIAKVLVDGKVAIDPSVTVTVTTYGGTASIQGAVGTPSVITLDHQMTLTEFLARAGGVRPEGGSYLIFRRGGKGDPEKIDLKKLLEAGDPELNIVIRSGDTVYVPIAPVYYLSGSVNHAGSYPLKDAMTVEQAIAQGGGITTTASDTRIKITRKGKDGKTEEVSVGLRDPVKADDTIYVPESWF